MRKISLAHVTMTALLPAVFACSNVSERADSVGTQASAVQGGELDTVRSHNFAVGIASRYGAVCSGTLIAPNLVLTARHCVVPPDGQKAVSCADKFPSKNVDPANLYITTEPRMRSAKNFYVASEITTPDETGFCGNDIALIQLEQNIPASEATPAIPVVEFPMTDASKLSGEVTAVGYGITAPNASDSGIRRIRENIGIVCIPGDTKFDCKKSQYGRMLDSDKEFITEGYVCSGDSGGGAFDQESFTNGTPYVLGALSRGPQTETECLAAIYSRTDAHADLIKAAAKKAQAAGGYTAPTWLEPKPEEAPAEEAEGENAPAAAAEEGAPVTTVTKTTTGCAAAPGSTSSGFAGLALAAAAVVIARRRRAS